jgi:hypothetical protein
MCAEKFIAKFLPRSKITKLRRNLTLFVQEDGESLYKTWERYSKIFNLCPNHGYVEYVILHIFYDGINEESKSILDLSAGGRFMSLTLEEGRELIERIVSAQEQWNIEEPVKPTRKIYHIEDMEEFKKVTQEKGKPI